MLRDFKNAGLLAVLYLDRTVQGGPLGIEPDVYHRSDYLQYLTYILLRQINLPFV